MRNIVIGAAKLTYRRYDDFNKQVCHVQYVFQKQVLLR